MNDDGNDCDGGDDDDDAVNAAGCGPVVGSQM